MNPYDLEPGFDPRIADWLEDDPTMRPDQVLETVLAAVPRSHSGVPRACRGGTP